ncbi:MAG: App1 family protein [Chitinophagales bacterium]
MSEKTKTTELPLMIMPYRGYGNKNFVNCRGRLLKDKGIDSNINHSTWQNLKNSYKRFESDEISSGILNLNFQGLDYELVTNKEGYFLLQREIEKDIEYHEKMWHKTHLTLLEAAENFETEVTAEGEIMFPAEDADFGVISDLDDTLIQTNVISKIRMIYTSIAKNAYTRAAFRGVPAFYWALKTGKSGAKQNPIFYVSNSPWNLYDMLVEFMDINHIPKGPILLRDFGLHKGTERLDYENHKYNEIVNILETYPNMKFILIGDSGEKDADIYLEMKYRFPNRILAIYIRSVNEEKRDERVKLLAKISKDVPLILIKDSLEAAKHAAENDWISKENLAKVHQSMYAVKNDMIDAWFDEE